MIPNKRTSWFGLFSTFQVNSAWRAIGASKSATRYVHTTAIYSDTRTLMVFCQQIAWEKTIFRKLTDKYNYEQNKNAFQ